MKPLYIVATPIGNLKDITVRALEILRQTPVIICENPQHSRKLLSHYGMPPKSIIRYTEGNRRSVIPKILAVLRNEPAALVVDAGTPAISDPGADLVAAVRKAGGQAIAVPGPSALIAAYSASGITSNQFIFAGFLPRKPNELLREVAKFLGLGLPIIGYEAPHRIMKTLKILAQNFPDMRLTVAKELTKLHEEIIVGTASQIGAELENKMRGASGEFVIILNS